jgi:quinol monooxygenase YgiN
MALSVFACFHAREGQADAVAAALREVVAATRAEADCRFIDAHRATTDPRLFHIHSRWTDEAAFEIHTALPHTMRFLSRVQPLVDHPVEVTRARPLDGEA